MMPASLQPLFEEIQWQEGAQDIVTLLGGVSIGDCNLPVMNE